MGVRTKEHNQDKRTQNKIMWAKKASNHEVITRWEKYAAFFLHFGRDGRNRNDTKAGQYLNPWPHFPVQAK